VPEAASDQPFVQTDLSSETVTRFTNVGRTPLPGRMYLAGRQAGTDPMEAPEEKFLPSRPGGNWTLVCRIFYLTFLYATSRCGFVFRCYAIERLAAAATLEYHRQLLVSLHLVQC
jgi:hypothetical protein